MAADSAPPRKAPPAAGDGKRTKPISHGEASDALNSFFNIFQDALSAASSDNRHKAAWRGPDASQYSSEVQILREHYTPLLWGVGSAVVTFLAFRVSGSVQLGRAAGGGGNIGGFKLSRVGSRRASTASGRSNGRPATGMAAANDAEAKSQLVGRILSIPVDLSLSLLIGCSVTLFLSDTDKLRRDMSAVPMVEGRSLMSDELCGDFVKEYNKRPVSFWNGVNAEEQPSLDAIQTFVWNCRKRGVHEDMLRKEQGLGPDDPVVIPKPGVPSTVKLLDFEKGEGEDDSRGGGEEQVLKEYMFMTGATNSKEER